MGLNRFRTQVILRTLLVAVMAVCLVVCLFKTKWIITPTLLGIGLILAVQQLIVYVERTNREVAQFLQSIKSSDFANINVRDKRGQYFSELKNGFNTIIDTFQHVRIEKEASYIYLQNIMEHVDIAIISFDEQGNTGIINEAAKKLLSIPHIRNIEWLRSKYAGLLEQLLHIKPGLNPVYKMTLEREELQLTMRATEFIMQGQKHRLVSIQNIKNEIEHTEIEAWGQLLRVLTHEIMNSITPISSLSSTLKNKTDELLTTQKNSPEILDEVASGLHVIEKRSQGLIQFVQDYRSITNPPVAAFKPTDIAALIHRVQQLKQKELREKGIELIIHVKPNLPTITIDSELTEQVLINLVNNAADAVAERINPKIELSVGLSNDQFMIHVADNGTGIAPDTLAKIFVPFYTTKKNGSGIGLSLAKQIMQLHGGSITVQSEEGKGAVFCLVFAKLIY